MNFQQVQNFKASPDDVIIASFPKSGTTWVQEIVHQISMIQASKQERKNSDIAVQEVNIEELIFILMEIFKSHISL